MSEQTIKPKDATPPRASHHKRRFILELTEEPVADGEVSNVIKVGAFMITEDKEGSVVSSTIDKTSIAHKTGGWMVDMLNTYALKMHGVVKLEPLTENLVPDTSKYTEEASYEEVQDGKEESK